MSWFVPIGPCPITGYHWFNHNWSSQWNLTGEVMAALFRVTSTVSTWGESLPHKPAPANSPQLSLKWSLLTQLHESTATKQQCFPVDETLPSFFSLYTDLGYWSSSQEIQSVPGMWHEPWSGVGTPALGLKSMAKWLTVLWLCADLRSAQ